MPLMFPRVDSLLSVFEVFTSCVCRQRSASGHLDEWQTSQSQGCQDGFLWKQSRAKGA